MKKKCTHNVEKLHKMTRRKTKERARAQAHTQHSIAYLFIRCDAWVIVGIILLLLHQQRFDCVPGRLIDIAQNIQSHDQTNRTEKSLQSH